MSNIPKLLAGHGAVTTINRPEDFWAVREAFEQGAADEVIEEMRTAQEGSRCDLGDTMDGVSQTSNQKTVRKV